MTAPASYDISAAAAMTVALNSDPTIHPGEARAALAVFACLIGTERSITGLDQSLTRALDLSEQDVTAYSPPL